jgi:alkylation response protein AidB-like acyl-CoA dehydrogenase
MGTREHVALRSAIRRFVDREIVPHVAAWEEDGYFPNSIFKRLGELGYLGIRYPLEVGGGGGDYLTAVILAEELSRCGAGAIPMAVAVQTEMATPAIHMFGTTEQKENYLRPALSGSKIAAIAITEPDAGSDVASISTTARREGDSYLLSGRKTFITNGARADFCTLVATTDKKAKHAGIGLFLVDTNLPGFSTGRPFIKVGMRSSDTVELSLDNVRIPAANLIGGIEGQGFGQLMAQLQFERIINAVLSVSQARHGLAITIEYIKQRHAFGRPIGSFQAAAHKIADVATELAAAYSLTYSAISQVVLGNEADDTTVSMAKKYAAQVQGRVADLCVQLHGGMGYMEETLVNRQWRDSRLQRIGAGADEVMNEIISKRLGLGERLHRGAIDRNA